MVRRCAMVCPRKRKRKGKEIRKRKSKAKCGNERKGKARGKGKGKGKDLISYRNFRHRLARELTGILNIEITISFFYEALVWSCPFWTG